MEITAQSRFGIRVAPVTMTLARVLDRRGTILGHVEAIDDVDGPRFRAQRFHIAQRRFLELGTFSALNDAVDCLRPC